MKLVRIWYICSVLFIASCNTDKVTEVHILNENNYPISVKIITNNIDTIFKNIAPAEQFTGLYNWTKLQDSAGQWEFHIYNANTNNYDKFTHGYFKHGELSNYVDLECKGDQLKIKISE